MENDLDILILIKILTVTLSILVIASFLLKAYPENLNILSNIKTTISGFLANFFDTLGIGSFAIIVALRKVFNLMPDDVKLIGTLNIQGILPTALQALIFLHFIDVDLTTLIVACTLVSLGGFLSGFITVRVSKILVIKIMLFLFTLTGVIILLSQLGIITPNTSGNHGIFGHNLWLFGALMFCAGLLPAFGIGFYVLVQIFIFLFGANQAIAFPIMATACAFQMPITAIPFIAKKKFYTKSSILLMLGGIIGVIIAAPLVSYTNPYYLKWILLCTIIYNIIALAKKFSTTKNAMI
jgi:uncharacterized membrane protein YfcA